MEYIKPPKLNPGDRVGICSPSGTIEHKRELFDRAKTNFEALTGLSIVTAPHAFAKHEYSAGTPQERVEDFHFLLKDPSIKAILFSAGGDTASDLLPLIDFDLIQKNPKIISGISDATTLLSPITARTGLITFLGFEFLDYAEYEKPYELKSLQDTWFIGAPQIIHPNPNWKELRDTPTRYTGWQTIREGHAAGRLVGGNSESYIQLLDTPYDFRLHDSILFLETYKLPKKQIHKELMQLKMHGAFEHIAGLVMGYCLQSDNEEVVGNTQLLKDTVLEVTSEYSFPIMQLGEIGHFVENFIQPIGASATMDATTLHFELTESTVS